MLIFRYRLLSASRVLCLLTTLVALGLMSGTALATPETPTATTFDTYNGAEANQVVPGLKEVTQTATEPGRFPLFSLALTNKGTVEAWQYANCEYPCNYWGELGNGTKMTPYPFGSPGQVKVGDEVTAISAGGEHSLVLLKNGTVMSWGRRECCEDTQPTPEVVQGVSGATAISAVGRLALLKNGTVLSWEDGGEYVKQVEGLTGVTAIAGGSRNLALLSNGTVMEWYGTGVPVAVPVIEDATMVWSSGLNENEGGGEYAYSGGELWRWEKGTKPTRSTTYTKAEMERKVKQEENVGPIPMWDYNHPNAVAIDPSTGNVWLTDNGNDRIVEYRPTEFGSDEYLRAIGKEGTGHSEFTFADELYGGIAVNGSGGVYVASGNGRIQEFNAAGEWLRQFGETGVSEERIGMATGVAVDSAGDVWVDERTKVKEFSSVGKYLGGFSTGGKWGNGIAVSEGHVYVVEVIADRVQEFSISGAYVREFDQHGTGNGKSGTPSSISADPVTGDIFVADLNGTVQKFSPEGAFLAKVGEYGTPRGIATLDGEFALALPERNGIGEGQL